MAEIENEIVIQISLKDIQDNKIEFLENKSRRNNIRVDSIPEDDHKTLSSTEIVVKHILEEKLDLSFEQSTRVLIAWRQGQDHGTPYVSE